MVLFIGILALIIFVYTKYDKIVQVSEGIIKEAWATHNNHEPSRKILHNIEIRVSN